MTSIGPAKFKLGQVVATTHAVQSCAAQCIDLFNLLARHFSGDWGDLGAHDKALNDAALVSGEDRIFSAYDAAGERLYVITAWDRSYTTVMLASDY